jgi:serine phosphatase RsbU (regulator of sigma subunit)
MHNKFLEWGIASRPIEGEEESGDDYVIRVIHSHIIIGVIDGLGHGIEAAHAAKEAVRQIKTATFTGLDQLLTVCHDNLRKTRGAVMTLVDIDLIQHQLNWTGVGNIASVLIHTDNEKTETLLTRGGVVGGSMPTHHIHATQFKKNDILLMASDGIKDHFREINYENYSMQDLADTILNQFNKNTDDALILAVRIR